MTLLHAICGQAMEHFAVVPAPGAEDEPTSLTWCRHCDGHQTSGQKAGRTDNEPTVPGVGVHREYGERLGLVGSLRAAAGGNANAGLTASAPVAAHSGGAR